MFDLSEKIQDFVKKYGINILSKSKRCVQSRKIDFFAYAYDKEVAVTGITGDTEPMITLDIPLSRLEALTDIETIFFNHIPEGGRRRLFADWMDQQQEEKMLRAKHLAVKEAYEHYSLMLHLVSHGRSSTIVDEINK